MSLHSEFRASLVKWLGPDKVVFLPGWDKKQRGIGWKGKFARPVALMGHHTAGAATESTDPNHSGNKKGANQGVIDYVNSKAVSSGTSASNFTLDRDGTVYVNTLYPCWHSGEGSFKGVPGFQTLGIPDDQFADYGLGVEIVSKGAKKDFTRAQKESFGLLANACKEHGHWAGFYKRLPNHKTWAGARKVDTRYTVVTLRTWAVTAFKKFFGETDV